MSAGKLGSSPLAGMVLPGDLDNSGFATLLWREISELSCRLSASISRSGLGSPGEIRGGTRIYRCPLGRANKANEGDGIYALTHYVG